MSITDHKPSAPVGKQSFIKRFFLGLKSGQASKNAISFRYVYWVDDSWFYWVPYRLFRLLDTGSNLGRVERKFD